MSRAPKQTKTPMMVYTMGLDDPFATTNPPKDNQDEGDEDDDEEFHDSEDSDDETNVLDTGGATNVTMAGNLMRDLDEDYPRFRLRNLQVDFNQLPSKPNNNTKKGGSTAERPLTLSAFRPKFPPSFHAFVSALQSYFRIKKLRLVHGNFGDANNDNNVNNNNGIEGSLRGRENDIKLLFGTVLSNHLSLQELTLSQSRIAPQYFKLYTDSFLVESPDFHFVRLVIDSTPLQAEHTQLLQQMLNRQVRLFELELTNCGLTADDWHVIATGVQGNPHLHSLTLAENHAVVAPATLLPLVTQPSSVQSLNVRTDAAWSEGAFDEFVKALRTNDVLREVNIHGPHELTSLKLVEELLTAHKNFTLETFALVGPSNAADADRHEQEHHIQQLLARNRRLKGGGAGAPEDGAGASSATEEVPNAHDNKKRGHELLSE